MNDAAIEVCLRHMVAPTLNRHDMFVLDNRMPPEQGFLRSMIEGCSTMVAFPHSTRPRSKSYGGRTTL
jgi:hypothetical protein